MVDMSSFFYTAPGPPGLPGGKPDLSIIIIICGETIFFYLYSKRTTRISR